jgi:hypothetical protein
MPSFLMQMLYVPAAPMVYLACLQQQKTPFLRKVGMCSTACTNDLLLGRATL